VTGYRGVSTTLSKRRHARSERDTCRGARASRRRRLAGVGGGVAEERPRPAPSRTRGSGAAGLMDPRSACATRPHPPTSPSANHPPPAVRHYERHTKIDKEEEEEEVGRGPVERGVPFRDLARGPVPGAQ
jgi:hypothetical protein